MKLIERVARAMATGHSDCFTNEMSGMANQHHLCVFYEMLAKAALKEIDKALQEHGIMIAWPQEDF